MWPIKQRTETGSLSDAHNWSWVISSLEEKTQGQFIGLKINFPRTSNHHSHLMSDFRCKKIPGKKPKLFISSFLDEEM